MTQPTPNRAARRAQTKRRGPSKKAVGASVLAIGSLLSTYAGVLRPTAAYAAVNCTVTNGLDAGAGSLRDCIAQINADGDGGTVTIQQGLTIELESELVLTKPLALSGGGATVQPAGGADGFRMMDVQFADNLATLTVSDLAVYGFDVNQGNNDPAEWGGGFRLGYFGGSFAFDNVTFRNNDGFQGGAISTIGPVGDEGVQENRVGVLSITNSIVESNHAGFLGGAVLAESQGGTTITGSLFADNRAEGEGGAVWLAALDGSTVNDSEFSGNSSTYAGGAASLIGPTSIVGSDFTDNNSGDGGAVYFNAWFPGEVGGVEIGDTTFSDNSASYGGGAISLPEPDTDYYPAIEGFEVTVENSTLTRNTSDGPGGAILNFQELDIVGTTISYNTAQDGGGGVTTYGNTTFSRSSVIANTSVDGAAGISLSPDPPIGGRDPR